MPDRFRRSLAGVSLRAFASTLLSRERASRFRLRLVLPAVAVVALLSAPSAWGTNFTVTDNSLSPTDVGSLLYALNNLATGSAATTNTITITATGTITLSSALPAITNGVTITGPGANQLTISGNNAFPVFTISSGSVIMSGLTIANGFTAGNGGAITNAGKLMVNDCNFSNNAASSSNTSLGGAIYNTGTLTVINSFFSGDSADSLGGGIYSTGTLIVSGSTLSGESAEYSGGAIAIFGGKATVANSTFDQDSAMYYSGGAIFNGTTLTVTNSTFFNNNARGSGGAITNSDMLTANNNIFSQNTASGGGAGIWNSGTTASVAYNVFFHNFVSGSEDDCGGCTSTNSSFGFNPGLLPLGNYGGPTQTLALAPGSPAICAGSAAAAVDANSTPLTSDQRGFVMDPSCASGSVDAGAVQTNQYVVTTLADMTDASPTCTAGATCSLRDAIGLTNTLGGDITFLASLTSVSVPGTITLGQGSAGDIALPAITGQANIFGLGANQLTVSGNSDTNVGSVITLNFGATATLYGLTIANGNKNNGSVGGGGIDNNGTLTVLNSAVSGNKATNGTAGGGIYSSGTLTVMDSTVSGNTDSQNSGGGIYNGGALTVTGSTIFGNAANDTSENYAYGGGIDSSGSFTLTGSTVSGNSAMCNQCLGGSSGGGVYVASGLLSMNNSIVAGNSVSASGLGRPAYADIQGSYTGTGNVASGDASATSDYATTLQLSPLQYNGAGATLQTLIPLPGSPAICASLQSNIPAGVTTDERGFPNTTTYPGYANNPCVDAGAVQSNYTSIAFAQQPSDTAVNTAITPSPAVEVIETNTITGATDTVSGVPVTLDYSGGAGELSGGAASETATTGLVIVGANKVNAAVFGLTPTTAGTGFTLSLGSNGTGIQVVTGDTLTATSNSFSVTQPTLVVTANAISFVAGTGFNGLVATFSYSVPTSALSDFTATIDWGDGSAPEVGTISQPGGVGTNFSVAGSHTYLFSGSFTINVTITPADGSASSGTNTETVSAGAATQVVVNYPTPVYAGIPETGTIVVEDAYGNVETALNGTATVTTSESTTAIPVTINSGFGTFVASFATAGTNQSVTAAFSTLTGVPALGITVNAIPSLVVTSTADSGTGSLREALNSASNDGAGNITFDPGVFATAQTINLTSGTLEVPVNTTITGPTTGSGATLTNLVTINGGGPSNDFSVFDVYPGNSVPFNNTVTVNSGTLTPDILPSTNAPAVIANLNIENGSNNNNGGGGITNESALTLTHDVFTGNSATGGASGGAVLNGYVLNVVNCTFTGNSQSGAGGAGGAIMNGGGGAVTITGSTFSGNTSSSNAGAILNNNLLTVTNSTFTGNVAAASGGAIASGHGTLAVTNSTFTANVAGTSAGGIGLGPSERFTLANSIVSGNWLGTATSVTKYDDLDDRSKSATFTSVQGNSGGNIVGYYNSPTATAPTPSIGLAPLGNYGGTTQTMIPLPGSPAICAGIGAQPGPDVLLSPDAKPPLVTLPTTDQRGLGLDSNCPSGSADVGAVQTNYSIAFTTEPAPVSPATQIVVLAPFQAAVTLKENGVAFFDGTDTIPIPLTLTAGPGGLIGGSVSASATTGIATNSALRINSPGANDQLTATLTLNGALTPAPGLVLTQTSSLFDVNKVPTTTALVVSTGSGTPSSSISITPGQSVKLTATVASSGIETTVIGTTLASAVAPAIGVVTLNGTVSFYDGSTLLGTVNLSAGVATYSTTTLAPGVTHALTATYNGNVDFAASSNTASATVTVAPLDFTMTLSGPTSLNVVPGGAIVYTVKVDPDYGSYAGTVNFTISGLPPGATVTFSPSTIAANGGPQTITVTIQTAAAGTTTVGLQHAPPPPTSAGRIAPFALAFLLLFGVGSLRRNSRALRHMLCVGLLLLSGAATTMLNGCGGNGFFSQAPHTYTILITFTAGGIAHTETVTLIVQ